MLVDGVAFKKTFSYAGFEQQPKKFENPKILCLNIELELKAEKDNAQVRIEDPSVRIHLLILAHRITGISSICGCRVEHYLREA